jgi:Ca-activated chloride channel homolog
MTFLWPDMLWLLVVLPVLVALYALLLRRQRRLALRFASLSFVRQAVRGGGIRRHLPPLLFLAAIASIIVAVARPATVMTLPTHHQTVILAVDVSLSMMAQDVAPDRITAAQEAAMMFVRAQPRNTRVGVVEYAGTASLVQPPTANRGDVLATIERLKLHRATAIGSGLLVSLRAIFPDQQIELPRATRGYARVRSDKPLQRWDDALEPGVVPVPPGSYRSAVIVLLTDGQNTTGPDPIEVARLAADRGVRVYTVGIGTPAGQVISVEGWQVRVRLDEETLKRVSAITHGEYFHADSADQLKSIYASLTARLGSERRETEITALFAALAGVLVLAGGLLSLLWFNRMV